MSRDPSKPNSKIARVLALVDAGETSNKVIAYLVGCEPEYVRVCIARRDGMRPTDREYRARIKAAGDLRAARAAGREARRAAVAAGGNRDDVKNVYRSAWRKVMAETAKEAAL